MVGENYLEMVRDEDSPQPDSVVEKFSKLLQGELSGFTAEYPCHGPDQPRWFRLYANEIRDVDEQAFLILHENITEERVTEAISDSIWESLLTHLRHRSENNRSETVSHELETTHGDQPIDPGLLEKGIESILRAVYNTGNTVEGIYSFHNDSPFPDWEIRIDQVANQSNSTQY